MAHVSAAIEALPPAQRAVIVLRGQQGLDAGEVCAALGISEGNMRVLLHRARLAVRAALDADKIVRARSLIEKGGAVRDAATGLKVGKATIYTANRSAGEP